MRHRKATPTLDRNSAQRQRLLRNLAISLIEHERMTTTAARATMTKAFVERLITVGKRQNLQARRLLLSSLNNTIAVNKILATYSPRYQKRAGGYLRSINVGTRSGDGAKQVLLEFIPEKA